MNLAQSSQLSKLKCPGSYLYELNANYSPFRRSFIIVEYVFPNITDLTLAFGAGVHSDIMGRCFNNANGQRKGKERSGRSVLA